MTGLVFGQFTGLSFDEEIPDFTTIWKFKEALVKEKLMDKIFDKIIESIESHGLISKKGTMVDATIINSGNRPLSKKKREELAKKPGNQIDTEAQSTAKNNQKYFGYKGLDVVSKIIRKRTFTAANVHDSQEFENVLSGDEQSVWGDKVYPNKAGKQAARASGIYYGVLDKARNEISRYHAVKTSETNKNQECGRRSNIRSDL